MQVCSKTTRFRLFIFTLVLFSPDDHPTNYLIKYIENAKERIHAAVFMLTDKNIAEALIDAHEKRKVDVQVVVDRSSADTEFGKARLLCEHGIPTYVFVPHSTRGHSRSHSGGALMHNKFAVIDNKLWTGSFNWTISANKRNQENVICTEEKEVCDAFLAQFEKLKTRCERLNPSHQQKEEPQSWGITETFSWMWAKIRSWFFL